MKRSLHYAPSIVSLAFLLVVSLLFPSSAFAYVGPGAGLSAFGSLLALIAAIIIGLFGFLWFPIKRMMKKLKKSQEEGDAQKMNKDTQ